MRTRQQVTPSFRRLHGFTLVELLVVIAIIGTLVGLLLPAVQAVRQSSARNDCFNNLKQVGLALQTYHDGKKKLPPGYVSGVDASGNDTGPGWGWAAHILPQMEQTSLFSAIDFKQGIEATAAAQARGVRIRPFLCPLDTAPVSAYAVGPRNSAGQLTGTACAIAPANYVGNFGVGEPGIDGDGLFFRNSEVRLRDITDGLSHTLMVGERSFRHAESTWVGAVAGANQTPSAGCTMGLQINNASNFVLGHTGESYDGPAGPTEINNFTSPHTGGACFVFADGHVSFLGSAIGYSAYKALSTRAEGEAVSGE